MNTGKLFKLLAFTLIAQSMIFEPGDAQPLKWNAKANTPITGSSGRRGAMCFAISDKVYVGGGYIGSNTCTSSFYEYSTATDTWTQKANLPTSFTNPVLNRSGGVAFTIGGKGYMGLGEENYLCSSGQKLLNDMWEYDPATNTWTPKANLPDTGRVNAGFFVINNKAYVIGGQVTTGGSATSSVWEFDPVADTWAAKAPFPAGFITNPFAFSVGSKGYTSCGLINSVESKKTFQFDPVTNSWTARANYPGGATEGGVAFAMNSQGYCGLGTPDYHNFPDTFRIYNPASDTWSAGITSFTTGRAFGYATNIGNVGYLGGGWSMLPTSTEVFYQDFYSVIDSGKVSGITELYRNDNMKLFPNPSKSNGILNIVAPGSVTSGEVKLYNLMGCVVTCGKWNNNASIDISNLAFGQYIVELNTQTNIFHAVLVISR